MLIRVLLTIGAAAWAVIFVSAALALAASTVSQLAALAVGFVPIVILLRHLGRSLTSREDARHAARDQERELLRALHERGALTAVTAALHTSLTIDEAEALLDALSRKGHVSAALRDGGTLYRLTGTSEPGTASAGPDVATPQAMVEPLGEPLSDREREVLALLALGRANKEIARTLFVAEGTVKTHTNNIYRKLNVRNRTEALVRARALGLVRDGVSPAADARS